MFSQPKLYKNDTLNFMINQLLTGGSNEPPYYPVDPPDFPVNAIYIKPTGLTPGGEHQQSNDVEYWIDENYFMHCVSRSNNSSTKFSINNCTFSSSLTNNDFYSLKLYISKYNNDANGAIEIDDFIKTMNWSRNIHHTSDILFDLETAASQYYAVNYLISSSNVSNTISNNGNGQFKLKIQKGSLWKKGEEIVFKIGLVKQTVTQIKTYYLNNYAKENYATNVDIDIENSNVHYQFNERPQYVGMDNVGISSAITTTEDISWYGNHYYYLTGNPVQYGNASSNNDYFFAWIRCGVEGAHPEYSKRFAGFFTNGLRSGTPNTMVIGTNKFIGWNSYPLRYIETACNVEGYYSLTYPITEAINDVKIIEVTAVDTE